MTASYYQSLRIFVSSPGDVREERRVAEDTIREVDLRVRDTLSLRADCVKWEHEPPYTHKNRIQQTFNELIKSCHVFILILNKRVGTADPGEAETRMEQEIDLARKMLEENRKITILSYFHEIPDNNDPGEQERKARELRTRLEDEGFFYRSYKDVNEFQNLLVHDLYNIMLRFSLSTFKQKCLRAFWQLGITGEQRNPKLVMIYPPVNRSFMPQEEPDEIWLKRLVPNVVFEDFKALQKVEKTLRLTGFREAETYTSIHYPSDLHDRNRLWICLPRNLPSLEQLKLYEGIARFRAFPRRGDTEPFIQWRGKSGWFKVESPLSKYLALQRDTLRGGEWRPEHGRIIAKDYAVLARFTDPRAQKVMGEATLKDFFLAGIRGLGTWGAAWFLDRKYGAFERYNDSEDETIQMLLEVTYVDEVIYDVRDVSDQPKTYFTRQNQESTIRAVIAKHHPLG
jgi:hypothetical protein